MSKARENNCDRKSLLARGHAVLLCVEMKNEHTPTPWSCYSSLGLIRSESSGKFICAMPHALNKNAIRQRRAGDEAKISEDAKFIVRCVNSHDELIAALKACLPQVEMVINGRDAAYGRLGYETQIDEIAAKARAAIAKAEAQ